jgi:rhodanese-related sulfurtransferase
MELFLMFVGEQWHWFAVLLLLFASLMWHDAVTGAKIITVNQLGSILNQDKAQLIDLRASKEFSKEHIVNAENIPHTDWIARAPEFAKQTTPLVLICKYGQQTSSAGRELIKHKRNMENVYRVRGGMFEWTGEKLPVVAS